MSRARAGFALPILGLALWGCWEAPPPRLVEPPPQPATKRDRPRLKVALDAIPPVTTDNRATLLVAAGPTAIKVSASSTYPGWPAENAIDGDVQTSWYSNTDDSAAKGKAPFFQLAFPSPSTVRRVTILGNRDPAFLKGYTILAGRLDLLGARGEVLFSAESEGTGNLRDFDFRTPKPMHGVKAVRFTSLEDEGSDNAYGDVAIAEMQVE